MASLDDYYAQIELQEDLVRILPNVHDLIAYWRAKISSSQEIDGADLTRTARALLGRLVRIYDFSRDPTTSATFDNAISNMNLTRNHIANRFIQYRDAIRVFRDAPKTNISEITAALNTLESSIPITRRFLNRPLPGDW